MDELKGKVAVVTGGASGIGLAMAERFVSEGMSVLLADIDDEGLRNAGELLGTGGAPVATMRCDTTSESDVAALADFALERFGAAHVLCNNAGIAGIGNAWTGSMDVWYKNVAVNLYGVIHGIRSFLPIMTEQGEGHIVNTASMAGLLAMPGGGPYNATKHAVVAISEGLYLELKSIASPIEVSVLCPGWVKTHIMDFDPDPDASPMTGLLGEFAKAAVDSGMAPAEVADQVFNAIVHRKFWILTHDDMRQWPVARMQRAASQTNPLVGQ